jgi:hypothetical protein
MICQSICSLETTSQHELSPGPVDNSEYVVRAAFTSHITRSNNKIKPAFISQKQFRGQQVSVWRISDVTEEQLKPIIPLIHVRESERVEVLLTARVEEIRLLGRNEEFDVRFCVLDECQTDLVGGAHKQHAHISTCRKRESFLDDEVNFEAAINKLRTLFQNSHKFYVT